MKRSGARPLPWPYGSDPALGSHSLDDDHKIPELRRFCEAVLRSSTLREAQPCMQCLCAAQQHAARNTAMHAMPRFARSAAIKGCAHHATLCCEAAHCAAQQHVAVVRSSTLLCCKAARCCAAKQHVAVLRSSIRREARSYHNATSPWPICLAWSPSIWSHAK